MITTDIQIFAAYITQKKPLIGVDHGIHKLGLAISDPYLRIATPLKVINNAGTQNEQIRCILKICSSYGVQAIVIGLPLNMQNKTTRQSDIVNNFALQMSKVTDLLIFLQNERLSSQIASNMLSDIGFQRRTRDKVDHQVAASIILERVLRRLESLTSTSH